MCATPAVMALNLENVPSPVEMLADPDTWVFVSMLMLGLGLSRLLRWWRAAPAAADKAAKAD